MLFIAVAKRSCRAERASFYTTSITGLTGMQPLALSKSIVERGADVILALELFETELEFNWHDRVQRIGTSCRSSLMIIILCRIWRESGY